MSSLALMLSEAEIQKIIADKYSSRGYKVSILPTREESPRFLKKFAPDILARSDSDNVVIEIKTARTPKIKQHLSSLAAAVQEERDWRLEVVYGDEVRQTRSRKPGRGVKRNDILNRLRDVENLIGENQNDAALLLLSAAIEAALRLLGKSNGNEFKESDSTNFVLKKIYAEGLLTKKQFDEFSDVFLIRNMIAHGIRAEIKNTPALIPTVIDQNPCAHLRMPRDMIFHGWSMRLFQAWQHSATMSS